jgi:hypothetical protein
VLPLDVPLHRARGVEPASAALLRADKGRQAEVFCPHMPLQRLVLPEALVAPLVPPAPEPLLPRVDGGVSPQSRGRDEGLSAAGLVADVRPLVGVAALDVLLQVLLLEVVLVAVWEGALEGSVVGVRAQVGGQAGWPVEGLGAVGVGALDRLEVRGEAARGGRLLGRRRGR